MLSKLLLALFAASCCYQVFASYLSIRFSKRRPKPRARERFSQVKPCYAPNPETLGCISDFYQQALNEPHDCYVLSAHQAPDDWMQVHPHITWLQIKAPQEQNGKAATLAMGQTYYSGEIFVISDSDMACEPEYLDAVLGEFTDPEVGVVTCLYRGQADTSSAPSVLESLFMLDFASSVLVAEATEGISFAMGSTMAIRRETLEDIGGFEALTPYLADDFQLGYKSSKKGWKIALAPTVMGTKIGTVSWASALSHQYRWLVTSRVSRPFGHFAFLITQGLFWVAGLSLLCPSLALKCLGIWCGLRAVAGHFQDGALHCTKVERTIYSSCLLPLKDLLYLPLWFRSLWGNEVRWGPRLIRLGKGGKIVQPLD